jgi:hypothetical protein
MKKNHLKRRTRISAEQRQVQNLITRLRAFENECTNVVAACREAQRRSRSE